MVKGDKNNKKKKRFFARKKKTEQPASSEGEFKYLEDLLEPSVDQATMSYVSTAGISMPTGTPAMDDIFEEIHGDPSETAKATDPRKLSEVPTTSLSSDIKPAKIIAPMMVQAFEGVGLRYKQEWLSLLVHRASKTQKLPSQAEVDMFALGVAQERLSSSHDQAKDLLEVLKKEVSKLQVITKEVKDIKQISKDATLELTKAVKDSLVVVRPRSNSVTSEASEKDCDLGMPTETLQHVLKRLGFAPDVFSISSNAERIRPYISVEEARGVISGKIAEPALIPLRNKVVSRVKAKTPAI